MAEAANGVRCEGSDSEIENNAGYKVSPGIS